MPLSLKWVLFLVAAAFTAAVASMAAQYLLTRQEAKLMAEPLAHGNVVLGKADVVSRGCGSCHSIPGIPGAVGDAGPSLGKVAEQITIAGHFANTPENLEAWLRHPHEMDPNSGMPDQGLGEKESRDIAAYLYTKR